jgi:hypothetical protein
MQHIDINIPHHHHRQQNHSFLDLTFIVTTSIQVIAPFNIVIGSSKRALAALLKDRFFVNVSEAHRASNATHRNCSSSSSATKTFIPRSHFHRHHHSIQVIVPFNIIGSSKRSLHRYFSSQL